MNRGTTTQAEAARRYGVHRSIINRLVSSGALESDARGRPYLDACARRWGDRERPTDDADNRDAFDRARARKMNAEASLAELKLEEERGNLVRMDEIVRVNTAAFASIRQAVMIIPDRICMTVAAESDPDECRRIMDRAVRKALTGAADKIRGFDYEAIASERARA
jgi:hypothetical protein